MYCHSHKYKNFGVFYCRHDDTTKSDFKLISIFVNVDIFRLSLPLQSTQLRSDELEMAKCRVYCALSGQKTWGGRSRNCKVSCRRKLTFSVSLIEIFFVAWVGNSFQIRISRWIHFDFIKVTHVDMMMCIVKFVINSVSACCFNMLWSVKFFCGSFRVFNWCWWWIFTMD